MLFSASVLLRCIQGDKENSDILWQENLVLCNSENIQEARKKAEFVGRKLENEYKSITGETVKWKFDSILMMYQLENEIIQDCDIIFSRHLRNTEVDSLKIKFS
jgi:hypothetical protein